MCTQLQKQQLVAIEGRGCFVIMLDIFCFMVQLERFSGLIASVYERILLSLEFLRYKETQRKKGKKYKRKNNHFARLNSGSWPVLYSNTDHPNETENTLN